MRKYQYIQVKAKEPKTFKSLLGIRINFIRTFRQKIPSFENEGII